MRLACTHMKILFFWLSLAHCNQSAHDTCPLDGVCCPTPAYICLWDPWVHALCTIFAREHAADLPYSSLRPLHLATTFLHPLTLGILAKLSVVIHRAFQNLVPGKCAIPYRVEARRACRRIFELYIHRQKEVDRAHTTNRYTCTHASTNTARNFHAVL